MNLANFRLRFSLSISFKRMRLIEWPICSMNIEHCIDRWRPNENVANDVHNWCVLFVDRMNPSHCYSFPIQVHLALLFHFVFLPLFLAQPIQTQSIKIRLLNCIACAYWSRSRSEPSRNLKKCRKWPVSMLLLKLCLACERRNNNQQRNMFCIGTSCPTTTLVQRSMCIGRTHTHTHCAPLEISVEMNGTSFAVMVQLQIGCVIDSNVLRTNQQMKSNE